MRRQLVFPPFCDIALRTLVGAFVNELLKASQLLAKQLQVMTKGEYRDVALITFGPFEAPVYRVDNKYRMRMVIKCKLNRRTLSMFEKLLSDFSYKVGKKNTLSIDFNPSSL